ncbi:hypothetical protein MKW92_003468 [Papaver armeniacum]|nr:hypothetical protein MKW92_003468 [Papaver armeniacum]
MFFQQTNNEEQQEEEKQIVTPNEVKGRINYDKLVDEFGCQRIDETLIDRLERVTKRPAHKGEKFYLYTGRGPSSEALHLGHLIPFMFTKYLQDAFKVPLVIQLTDDEKYVYKNLSVEETKRLARENAKDIIACGFDISRTFIFSDFGYVGGGFYENAIKVLGNTTGNQMHGTFGITLADSSAKFIFPGLQAAPSFPGSFPHLFMGKDKLRCLIPCAIDQDPYFRITRDVAPKLGYQKPALIESSFLPALQGNTGKMSASIPSSAIYVTDSADNIKIKVNKADTGGGVSLKEQQEHGANLDKDIPFKYLEFFLEDDAELEHIKQAYGSGKMLSGDIKDRLAKVLTQLVEKHCQARAAVTDEMVDAFMAVRPLPNMFH